MLRQINWEDPAKYAYNISQNYEYMVFLYSGINLNFTGRYSLIAFDAKEICKGDNFEILAKKLTNNHEKYHNAWFGYISYEMRHQLEELTQNDEKFVNTANMYFLHFDKILIFDHHHKKAYIYCENIKYKINFNLKPLPELKTFQVKSLNSNMDKHTYLEKVAKTKEHIAQGDIYQANITRKFYGELPDNINKFLMFTKLAQISPAPYSSFLQLADLHIISSSPERFINIDAAGQCNSRPIKGSAKKHTNKKEDLLTIESLKRSSKDQAENLMIVDLMRHDMAKASKIGSVKIDELFNVTSYSKIHHLDSSITSSKNNDCSTIEFVKNLFPAGSMTGAPKIKAMNICAELEKFQRGIYSGALGWFGGDGSCDLSVIIRTLIISEHKFEFQVGGAITADSKEESEWLETKTKAAAIAQLLGIKIDP
jgi:para-aminobenzoate synthetase component I